MKIFTGKVIAKNSDKTAKVAVSRIVVHPLYKKRYHKVKNYQVHDEMGVEVGQKVKFAETKPISRTKKWKVVEVINKNE